MSRALDDLSQPMRARAVELLARLTERGIAVVIVDTLRTKAEHEENLRNGTSLTALSRHLPRSSRKVVMPGDPNAEKSDAMDVCPYGVYALHGPDKLQWDAADPVWAIIGSLAEAEGLVWGGRWTRPHDPGHVELPRTLWEK